MSLQGSRREVHPRILSPTTPRPEEFFVREQAQTQHVGLSENRPAPDVLHETLRTPANLKPYLKPDTPSRGTKRSQAKAFYRDIPMILGIIIRGLYGISLS